MSTLALGVIGNCAASALIDGKGRMVWSCMPRPDGDPVFHALIDGDSTPEKQGYWSVEMENLARAEQEYAANTTVLITRLFDDCGNALEIVDYAPRFFWRERLFRPLTLVRRLRALSGTPRLRMRLRPGFDYGATPPQIARGGHHIRYIGPRFTLRLTCNAPIAYILAETPFLLEGTMSFFLGPDESLDRGIEQTAREWQEQTEDYWRRWVRRLALPLEWQRAVIRAALTLKLCTFEETGAIIAAMTTSIPEHADSAPANDGHIGVSNSSARNWDYRYCWLRDAFFVVRALNSLAEVETMENYLRYIANVVSCTDEGHLQPVYGIALERELLECEQRSLAGYRGMGPVRTGNQAYEHFQHDVYGNVILAAAQSFFDQRLLRPGTRREFERLELLGDQAYKVYNTPDAGMWELRTRARVHTSSALMCWAACDRLARIARCFELPARADVWTARAAEIRETIHARAWNERGFFAESFDGEDVEAGLLLMAEVGFIDARDPRFLGTLAMIEQRLKRGPYLFRYATPDDFGLPKTAFSICTFWYIDALIRVGREAEAREIFEQTLTWRTPVGLLSEDIDPLTQELWGNYPQTYSLVGIINAAMRLSRGWEEVV